MLFSSSQEYHYDYKWEWVSNCLSGEPHEVLLSWHWLHCSPAFLFCRENNHPNSYTSINTLMYTPTDTHTNNTRAFSRIHIHLPRQVNHPLHLNFGPCPCIYEYWGERKTGEPWRKGQLFGVGGGGHSGFYRMPCTGFTEFMCEPCVPAERQGGLISFMPCWMMQPCVQLWACCLLSFRENENRRQELLGNLKSILL